MRETARSNKKSPSSIFILTKDKRDFDLEKMSREELDDLYRKVEGRNIPLQRAISEEAYRRDKKRVEENRRKHGYYLENNFAPERLPTRV